RPRGKTAQSCEVLNFCVNDAMNSLAQVPFKPIEFLSRDVSLERRADGSIVLQSNHKLKPYEKCVPAFLAKWAQEAPERVWLAQRRGPQRARVTVDYGRDARP